MCLYSFDMYQNTAQHRFFFYYFFIFYLMNGFSTACTTVHLPRFNTFDSKSTSACPSVTDHRARTPHHVTSSTTWRNVTSDTRSQRSSGGMHGCDVRGPRFKSHHRQNFVCTMTATTIWSLGHGLHTLAAVPRSTQPSTLYSMVE